MSPYSSLDAGRVPPAKENTADSANFLSRANAFLLI